MTVNKKDARKATGAIAFVYVDSIHIEFCECGAQFEDGQFVVGETWAKACPECGRKLFVKLTIEVFEEKCRVRHSGV